MCFMCKAHQIGCKSSTRAINSLKLITLGSQTTEPGMGPKVTKVLTFTVIWYREYSSAVNPTQLAL